MLGNLIKEIKGYVNIWKSPLGTPDQVIEVVHRIMWAINKTNKNVRKYVSLTYNKEDGWIIQNPKTKRMIAYDENNNRWLTMTIGLESNEFAPINHTDLIRIIENWMI